MRIWDSLNVFKVGCRCSYLVSFRRTPSEKYGMMLAAVRSKLLKYGYNWRKVLYDFLWEFNSIRTHPSIIPILDCCRSRLLRSTSSPKRIDDWFAKIFSILFSTGMCPLTNIPQGTRLRVLKIICVLHITETCSYNIQENLKCIINYFLCS